jgi:FMN phosphatase YigB (HAD superfamily)
MKFIFLDFAETIGYRKSLEIDTDFEILASICHNNLKVAKDSYLSFSSSSGFYDRSLTFSSFFEEKEYALRHFRGFLNLCSREKLDNYSTVKYIVELKYNTITHALYPEVIECLEKYKKIGKVFILSDGRPSRRITLKQLSLDKYCEEFFISDEMNFTKKESTFYKKVLDKVGWTADNIFLDDQLINLDEFSRISTIKGYLIDRHKQYLTYLGKYTYVNELPNCL